MEPAAGSRLSPAGESNLSILTTCQGSMGLNKRREGWDTLRDDRDGEYKASACHLQSFQALKLFKNLVRVSRESCYCLRENHSVLVV